MVKRLLGFCVLALVVISCQHDTMDEDTEALDRNSALTAMLRSMSVNETTVDDIIDSTSCYKVKLPAYAIVNSFVMNIDTEADLADVQAAFDQSATDEDTVELLFPVTMISQDYREVKVNSQEELDALKATCGQVEDYIGDNCVSMVFPVTMYSYNSGFQKQETFVLNDNKEMYTMLKDLGQNQYYSVGYPVSLKVSGGAGVTVRDNNALMNSVGNAIQGCETGGCTNPGILKEGLLFYMTFSNGIVQDLKGNPVSAPTDIAFATDREGNQNCAIAFDGSQFLHIPANAANGIIQGEAFSVSLWFRMQNVNSNDYERLFAKGSTEGEGFELSVKNLNAPLFRGGGLSISDTEWLSDANLPVDTQNWHHLVVTVDAANNVMLYRDGELKNFASDASIGTQAMDYYIGAGFKGFMDDLRVYKKVLSATEVQTLFELDGDCNAATRT